MFSALPATIFDLLKQMRQEVFKDLRVCLPGSIAGVDKDSGTVSVKIGVMQNIQKPGQSNGIDFKYPQLDMCPVFSLQGGGVGFIAPIEVGDECIVVFSDRCIAGWYENGEAVPLPSFRMHNIADGFVLVGLNSSQNLLNIPLMDHEGGVCTTQSDTGAKVAVNSNTEKITVANNSQNLFTTLTNLGTTLGNLITTLSNLITTLGTFVTTTNNLDLALQVLNNAIAGENAVIPNSANAANNNKTAINNVITALTGVQTGLTNVQTGLTNVQTGLNDVQTQFSGLLY